MLKTEDVSEANRRLSRVLEESSEPELRFKVKLLRAQCYLLERHFGLVAVCVRELEAVSSDKGSRREVAILDAYAKALAGHSLAALRRVFPIIREAGRFEEPRARCAYIAGLSLFRRGHYQWARIGFWQALAYYRLIGDQIETSRTLNSLALLEKSAGHINLALEYFEESARLLPEKGCDRHRRRLLTNRGVCYLRLGNTREARMYLIDASSLSGSIRDLFVDVAIKNNLGHTYRMEGDFKAAESCYMKALELARESSSRRQECLALEFAGELYLEMGRLEESWDYLSRAHEIALELSPHGDLMMEILRRRGELRAVLGRFDDARADLSRAIQLCRSRGEIRERLLAERALTLLEVKEVSELQLRLGSVLEAIRELGDRFEYVRTVVMSLSRYGAQLAEAPWFRRNAVTATHYADSLGFENWRDKLNRSVGYSRELISRDWNESEGEQEYLVASQSRSFVGCLEAVHLASRSDSAVLISGETGVGKEVVARLVHERSGRANGPLVAINCGALPDGLVESELFGHARGTFTGAHRDKEGLLEAANGGSVFLDEVGELPLQAQVKLLRFLDSGEFRRVGETRVRVADVRVLAATNRNLKALADRHMFRKDLLFRLNVFHVDVPALRHRREDIVPLARFFLKKSCGAGLVPKLTMEVQGVLERYEWPGNIRELKNVCEYMAARAWGRNEIVPDDLTPALRQVSDANESHRSSFEHERLLLEREQIVEALRKTGGKVIHAARLLGMGRNTLAQRMKEHGIMRESFRV